MAIQYNEDKRLFTLTTDHSMYQMKVGSYGYLLHLYYGRPIGRTDASYRIQGYDRGFSGNPYDADNDRTFSLDTLPREYPCFGNGDYRTEALKVRNSDGSTAADLRYVSHKIYQGKYKIPWLPAVYADEAEAESLEILLADPVSGIQAVLYYGVISSLDLITRTVKIINNGAKTAALERVMSLCLDFQDGDFDLLHFYGRHAMERLTERKPLMHGVQSVGSTRGASSHHHNPFIVLCDRKATETQGECYGLSFVYSGDFLAEAEVDQIDQTRFVMGIHPGNFRWNLEAGESFTAPEVMMTYSASGFERMSHNLHRTVRDHICRGMYQHRRRPVLINNWEATYFDFDGEKLLKIAKDAGELGIEMFVMDDGWFGNRDSDLSGLGDWAVNESKLGCSLGEFAEKINEMDMKFGLWFEPEMVSEDSDLYREHPEWCMKIPDRPANRSRYQLILDISRKDCREYMMESIFKILDNANVEYVKWDMNRSISNVYSLELPPDHQGEVLHRYILGLYEMQEALISRYPKLLLENCSGGGGRFDAGMLYYSPQIWCSDNTDAVDRLKIQYGTSFGYPACTMGSHVSVCPNHQTGRTTPLKTRGVVAMGGTFGYELDLNKLTKEEKEEVREQIREYKQRAELVLNGDYYRLTDPFENTKFTAWAVAAADGSETLVSYVKTDTLGNDIPHVIRLRGLREDAVYSINGGSEHFTGAALMYIGIPMTVTPGEYTAETLYLKEV